MIKVQTSDNVVFEVEWDCIKMCKTLYDLSMDVDSNFIPLSSITSTTFQKILEYCQLETEPESAQDFFMNVDQYLVFDLILAANYLNIQSLLDQSCKHVASMIAGKTPQQIREHFNLEDDLSPEEKAKIEEDMKIFNSE